MIPLHSVEPERKKIGSHCGGPGFILIVVDREHCGPFCQLSAEELYATAHHGCIRNYFELDTSYCECTKENVDSTFTVASYMEEEEMVWVEGDDGIEHIVCPNCREHGNA